MWPCWETNDHDRELYSSGQSRKNLDSRNPSAEGFGSLESPFYGIGKKCQMLQLKDSGNPDSRRIWIPVIENMDSRLCFRTCEHCRNLDFYGIGHFRRESLSWRIRESLFFENPDSQKIFENPDYPFSGALYSFTAETIGTGLGES